MLKDINVDLEDVLSLVIGKNNTGKTSFLAILEKFLSESKPVFSFDDFNIETQKEILECENSKIPLEEYTEICLSLRLDISYTDADNLSEAADLILDLDNTKDHLVVLFEYVLEFEKYTRLVADYTDYKSKVDKRDFSHFVSKNINKYFRTRIRALEYENKDNYKEVSGETIRSIVSLQTIGARRDVDNDQGRSKSLSLLADKYYNASVSPDADFPELENQLRKTDDNLTKTYENLFKPIVNEIMEMSYNPQEAEISILSTLSEKKIFQDNTTVKYKHAGILLPEDYNGLGYLNLFAIIFHIRIKLDQLSKKNKPDENPTPINLLFIEEPEAHTHPQMQYVFIKNIKHILEKHRETIGSEFSLQSIISTHSSHIVSQCDFNDVKYFYRDTPISVKSRNLKSLYSQMVTSSDDAKKEEQNRSYRFVKQYVSLNRAELFFADKAVLIEGDTERMLLTAMMKKFDDLNTKEGSIPLMSQNISVVEVGAYSHIFATFLGFLGIRTLIVTDIDCAETGNGKTKKCPFKDADITTNASIKHFMGNGNLLEITSTNDSQRSFSYDELHSKWVGNEAGNLRLVFQKEENQYCGRSFEDSFICKNIEFIVNFKERFVSLKNRDKIVLGDVDYYDIAENCIDSKTSFALDILLYGGENGERWKTPGYIHEGLEWLAQ